jgi:hypothetical protein
LIKWTDFQNERPSTPLLTEWADRFKGCNFGVVTGSVSGIVVLDIDGEDGRESLSRLPPLPATPTVRTSRGYHYYFRHPGPSIRNGVGLLPGIDVRADGGYVVAPPSIHPDGWRYVWVISPGEAALADMPAWLLDLIERSEEPKTESGSVVENSRLSSKATKEAAKVLGEIAIAPEGERNDTLNRAAFKFGQSCAIGKIPEQWAREKLLEVALASGLTSQESLATIQSGIEAGKAKPAADKEPLWEIIERAPEAMDRPIRLINGMGYGATWVPVRTQDGDEEINATALVVFGEGGRLFSDRNITNALPISYLPFSVNLPHQPQPKKLLSSGGLGRWARGDHPNPAKVFESVTRSIDNFVSFEHSLADQRSMSEMMACWVIGTYTLDGFNVIGYPWPTGERGSGKTQLLNTVTALAYLGRTITSGTSFAVIRDEADYGATIAFDDCEKVQDMDSDKRELLLAGNMRGAVIGLKEPTPDGQWQTRYVNNFAPRLFSSIGLPDPVLGSRAISIPLLASTDKGKTRLSPSVAEHWPDGLSDIIDDLWLVSVMYLDRIRRCDEEASELSELHARSHDIWRVPLGVAYWLQQDHGVEGLFDRVSRISSSYQQLKQEVQGTDTIGLVLDVLDLLLGDRDTDVFETAKVLGFLKEQIEAEDHVSDEVSGLDVARVGKLLGRLGFNRAPSHGSKRSWQITRATVDQIAKARGHALPTWRGEKRLADRLSLPPTEIRELEDA